MDLDRIDLVAPRLTAALTDALPDHGVLVGIESAEAVGSVAVGPAAVHAAAAGGTVPVAGSPEEAVLHVARRIAAAAIGGASGGGAPAADFDIPAGVAAVETRGAQVIGRARVALGGAAEVGLGLDLEANGEGALVLERSVDVSGDAGTARDLLLG